MIEQIAVRGCLRRLFISAAAERGDARQPVPDIEGIGDLAELAIADDVDASRDLLIDNLVDGCGKTVFESRLIEGPSSFACLKKLQQIGRPRQAADMGRQDAVGA